MPDYRRNRVPGGCYFFTVALADRRSSLLVGEIDLLRGAVRDAWRRRPFHIDAWVVLPDHMHCVWTLPEGDADYPARWQAIKSAFSRGLVKRVDRRASLVRKREAGLWQRRYWERTIRDQAEYAACMNYVHFNPVRHGLVSCARDWPFSTFARCVRQGLYPADWAGGDVK